jgi:RNA polymerase sigma-70 factor (ECF subfamily)
MRAAVFDCYMDATIGTSAGQALNSATCIDHSLAMSGLGVRREDHALARAAYRVALKMLGDEAQAWDIAGETMAILWARFERPENEGGYVTRVAKNLSKNKLRSRGRELSRLERWAAGEADRNIDETDRMLSRLVIREAVRSLPRRQRQAITYCYFEGLDRSAAARKMGVEVASVKTHLKRGFAALRHHLSDDVREII